MLGNFRYRSLNMFILTEWGIGILDALPTGAEFLENYTPQSMAACCLTLSQQVCSYISIIRESCKVRHAYTSLGVR